MKNLGNDIHQIYWGDCIKTMNELISNGIKVDLVIADLPYGQTANNWDKIIPFNEMWDCLKRIRKDEHTPILLFADDPFSAHLQLSNEKWFRYKWYWNKQVGTGFLDCAWKPLKVIEQVMVFIEKPFEVIPSKETWKKYDKVANYYPQFEKGKPNHSQGTTLKNTNNNYGSYLSLNQIKSRMEIAGGGS